MESNDSLRGQCGKATHQRQWMVRRSRPLAAAAGSRLLDACLQGGRSFPLDEELGVKGRDGTPELPRVAAPLAAEPSFERAEGPAELSTDLSALRNTVILAPRTLF